MAVQVVQTRLVGFKVQMKAAPGSARREGDPREGPLLKGVRLTQQKATPSLLVNFPPLSFGKRGDKGGVEAPSVPFHPPGCIPGCHGSRCAGGGALQVADAKSSARAGVGILTPSSKPGRWFSLRRGHLSSFPSPNPRTLGVS